MARKDRFILLEEETQEILPAVELQQEPLTLSPAPETLPTEENIPEEVKVNAFSSLINGAISREFESIDALNSAISTFMVERPEDLASIEIFKRIIEEKTAHVGMLQAVMGIVDGKVAELVKSGKEKAEEIVAAEPEELKEDITGDDYWKEYAEGELDFRLGDEEWEVQGVLLRELSKEDIEEIIDFIASSIKNNDRLWEHVNEITYESIEYWVKKKFDPKNLTAEINPEK